MNIISVLLKFVELQQVLSSTLAEEVGLLVRSQSIALLACDMSYSWPREEYNMGVTHLNQPVRIVSGQVVTA